MACYLYDDIEKHSESLLRFFRSVKSTLVQPKGSCFYLHLASCIIPSDCCDRKSPEMNGNVHVVLTGNKRQNKLASFKKGIQYVGCNISQSLYTQSKLYGDMFDGGVSIWPGF